jgi:rhodanese-related sulfurtransferase
MGDINWASIAFMVLLALILFVIVYMRSAMKKNVTYLNETDFANVMRKGQLIDIRKKNEFDEGHINGSRNIPIGTLNKTFNKLRTDQPIYLVCADGKASKRATMLLISKNFSDVYALEGGIAAWTKSLKAKK